MDHDQPFKQMVKEFACEVMELFLPWLARRLIAPPTNWPNPEVFTNPPLGRVLRLDLVVELSLRGATKDSVMEHLLDVEVESATSLTEVRKKIAMYYPVLRHQSSKRVTVLAFYLKVALDGLGLDKYVEYETQDPAQPDPEQDEAVYQVRWRYVGLPGLHAKDYLGSKKILAVALCALMKIDEEQRGETKAEILRRIKEEFPEANYRRLLLINCVESYLVLAGDQLDIFQRLLQHEPKYKEIPDMIQTTYGKGIADGKAEGKRETLIRLAKRKCGEPSAATKQQIQQIEDIERLEKLIEAAAFTAESWEDLLAIE